MSDLTAIDILINPDEATIERARKVNALLRESVTDGFALDATHQPHIKTPRRSSDPRGGPLYMRENTKRGLVELRRGVVRVERRVARDDARSLVCDPQRRTVPVRSRRGATSRRQRTLPEALILSRSRVVRLTSLGVPPLHGSSGV